jgi:hypothetical protein
MPGGAAKRELGEGQIDAFSLAVGGTVGAYLVDANAEAKMPDDD